MKSIGMIKNMSTGSLESLPDYESDDFEIIAKLGVGFFSDVYLAKYENIRLVKKVAKSDQTGDSVKQLQNERQILSLTDHEHIINMVAELPGTNSMILELCPGGELAHYISYFGRFTLSMTKFYAREIGSGLAYLHSRNIIHNDLKAENVLLTQMGHVRITDFGTSKIVKGCQKLTGMEGTPGNVPPEMLTEKGYSYPRDWWSFGVLVYQMLVGSAPFRGQDQLEIFMAILMNEPQFPDFVDKSTRLFLDQLLDKDPDTRLSKVMSHEWMKSNDSFAALDTESKVNVLKRIDPDYAPPKNRRSSVAPHFIIGD
jgi:serine/threonine protein kinase